MDTIVNFACEHAHSAHWFFFMLLMMAGLNIPLSEDIILLTGGAIASTCLPDHSLHLFIWIYFGCWISAWEAYWIGRLLGPKLYEIRWFKGIITPHRIERLHYYYEKFGVFTFMIGRFIPGGVRNALFMSAGLGKMPFYKFIARDGFACLISASTIFSVGYLFGENYQTIIHYVKTYNEIAAAVIVCAVVAIGTYLWYQRRKTA